MEFTFDIYGGTDKGLVRDNNEDDYWISKKDQIFIIADGLGGLPHGEVASYCAVRAAYKAIKEMSVLDLKEVFSMTQAAVTQAGNDLDSQLGIATTLTLGKIENNYLRIGHVGDSGIILFRDKGWEKLTTDHTMAEEMKQESETAKASGNIPEYYTHILTRCIGHEGKILDFEEKKYLLQKKDKLLFYTDGITKALSLEELNDLAIQNEKSQSFIESIIAIARKRGGVDNATAIGVFLN